MVERRNIGIIAHIDAGKTTLTEKLLHASGIIRRAGDVEDGSTVSDWQRQEQERGITIGSAAVTCQWRELAMTIVDTPGHVDFTIEVTRCLRVLDGAIVVLSGPDGVQAQTLTNWVHLVRQGLPAVGFINKLDQPGFDNQHILDDIEARLGVVPIPLQVPVHVDRQELVLLDVLSAQLMRWDRLDRKSGVRPPERLEEGLSTELEDRRVKALERIVEVVSDYDDALAECYLNDEPITQQAWAEGLRAATLSRNCLPVFYGCARAGAGPGELLTWLSKLLPEPSQHVHALHSASDSTTGKGSPMLAYVFKTEPRGANHTVAFVRLFRGEIQEGMALHSAGESLSSTPIQLLQLFGGDGDRVSRLTAGEIGGLVFEGEQPPFRSGTTLSGAPKAASPLEPLTVPNPVIWFKIEADTVVNHRRMRQALDRLIVHDPSMAVLTDGQTGDTLLAGMGKLHLELALERLRTDEQLEVRHGPPQPRNRAIILKPARASSTVTVHDTTHGHIQLTLRLEPRPRDLGSSPEIICDQELTAQWRAAVVAGVESVVIHERDTIQLSVQIESIVTQGSSIGPHHLWQAARDAVNSALDSASLRPAEPWMDLSVLVPNDAVGRVSGDIARRRGRIVSTLSRGSVQVLTVEGPLVEMIDYATALRSLTAGMGTFTMRPAGYRPLSGEDFLAE